MKTKDVTITPEMAKQWLECNDANRPLNSRKARMYADDMLNGRWQYNGETISIGEDGRLKNGQHRLMAIVIANQPQLMRVDYGVPNSVTIYDRGKGRTTLDTFVMGGRSRDIYNNITISIARLHYMVQHLLLNKSNIYVSDTAVEEFISKNEDTLSAIVSLRKYSHSGTTRVSTQSAVILLPCYYAYKSGVPIEKLDEFCRIVNVGYGSGDDISPAVTIRNDIMGNKININGGGSKARILGCWRVERAIADYVEGKHRAMSYTTIDKPTYSDSPEFREERT